MSPLTQPLRVGFIGYGTIACRVEAGIRAGNAGHSCVAAALVRQERADAPNDILVTADPERFLSQPLDVVIEAAGQESIHQHGEAVLRSGMDFLVLSVGALADDDLFSRLQRAAEDSNAHLLALQTGTDRDAALAGARVERVLLYEGSAREAVRLFPANVNVAAALSLAGVGFDRTQVRVYADPSVTRNTHEVHARGWFGELSFTIQNVPTENPKTGRITALSVLKILRDYRASTRLVG